MSKRDKDFFYKLAKKKGVNARSYFKLEQIEQKFRVFKPGMRVLDIGCAPGSWLQYVHELVGQKGELVGIDLAAMSLSFPNLVFYQEDLFDVNPEEILQTHGLMDVVISDIAPKTTGQKVIDIEKSFQLCKKALSFAKVCLKENGDFVCKMFHGETFDDFHRLMKQSFHQVHIYRPQATRKISKEIFWVGKGKKRSQP